MNQPFWPIREGVVVESITDARSFKKRGREEVILQRVERPKNIAKVSETRKGEGGVEGEGRWSARFFFPFQQQDARGIYLVRVVSSLLPSSSPFSLPNLSA